MTILIVDDLPEKIDKIQKTIEAASVAGSHMVFVTMNVADTIAFLLEKRHIDLMILDLNLPVRKDVDIKPLSGLTIIKEINRRDLISRPVSIIGLTAKNPVDEEAVKFFQEEAWSLITYDQTSSKWETAITNKINYHRSPVVITPSKSSILYVSSSPKDQESLSLGTEVRRIKDTIRMSTYRDEFEFTEEAGSTFDNFSKAVLAQPPYVLHLSGHGDEEGFAMEDALGFTRYIPIAAIDSLLKPFAAQMGCIILSACFSAQQAELLSKHGIYAVGITLEVALNVAENFSVGFYQGLCEKKTIEQAFQLGLSHAIVSDDFINSSILLFQNGKQIF